MKNITSKEKELKVAIPNKLFKEIDIYSCNSKDGVALQVAKIIHLYYKLYLLTPMNFNKLRLINLNIICEMFNTKAQAKTLKGFKDRLIFLQEQGYIKVNMNIEDIKSKNDLFDIEFLVPDDLLSDGFTFLNANEVEYFLNEEDTNKALVFLFIKRCLNDKRGYAFPTIEYIGFCTTLSKNSIMKALKELKEEGIITIDNPNFYSVDKNTGEIRKSNNTYTIKQENLVNEENKEEVIEEKIESDIKEDSINIKEEIIETKEDSIIDKFKKFDISKYSNDKKDGLYTFDDINNKETIVTQQYNEIQFPENPF